MQRGLSLKENVIILFDIVLKIKGEVLCIWISDNEFSSLHESKGVRFC